MALFTELELIKRANINREKFNLTKTASTLLLESARSFSSAETYDIFLSHNIADANIVLGLQKTLEDLNYKVYVDWVVDPHLDRNKVSKETAAHLRERLKSSNSLFFVTSSNSVNSKWMPWECGYFDGFKGKVAIVPVTKENLPTNEYKGQEYLGLYPYALKEKVSVSGSDFLWVHQSLGVYLDFDTWVKTPDNLLKWHKP